MIAFQVLHLSEESLKLPQNSISSSMLPHSISSPRIWKPPDHHILKVNTYVAYFESKIGIGILVRNHLGIPLIAKCIPPYLPFFY